MNFTDQKPRIATDEHVKARWCAGAPGEKFRCYLCGYKFKVGDQWRWVYNNGPDKPCNGNFLVCEKCDEDGWIRENKGDIIESRLCNCSKAN